jgi:hypothetical protein
VRRAIRIDLLSRRARSAALLLLLELPIEPVATIPARELLAPLVRRGCR